MRQKYVGVALPKSLVQKIDEVVKKDTLGYKSRPELIKDAVRTLLLKLKNK